MDDGYWIERSAVNRIVLLWGKDWTDLTDLNRSFLFLADLTAKAQRHKDERIEVLKISINQSDLSDLRSIIFLNSFNRKVLRRFSMRF